MDKLISANHIINLSEEWFKDISAYGKKIPIYVNPGSTDFIQIFQSFRKSGNLEHLVRFIADGQQGKVYIWDGALTVHITVSQNLGMTYNDSKLIFGYAKLNNGVLTLDREERIEDKIKSLWGYVHWGFDDIEMKRQFGKDMADYVNYLNKVFSYNWSWLDRHIKGFNSFLTENKSSFAKWISIYSHRWVL